MAKPSFSQTDHLEALVKAYQYLTGLISDREVWLELEKVLVHYFKADLVGFLGRRPDGELVWQHLSHPGQTAAVEVLQQTAATAQEVLESGFLATEVLRLPDGLYSAAFLPVSERKQAIQVMLVGHRTAEPLPRALLDIYLAMAGLCGATLERLSSERRVQRMTEKVPEMLFELLVYPTGDLQFTYVSRQSRAIFFQPPDALLDKPGIIFNVIHPDDRAGFLSALTGAVAEGSHLSREIRCLAPSAQERYILFHALASQQEDHVVWDGAFLDITERKRAEAEIYKLNAELEQRVQERTAQLERANKELESFAYSVSHDLRAPLRAIDGFSRILLEECQDKLNEEGKGYLGRIIAGSRRMGQLIDDILKLSRLSRTEMVFTQVNLSALVGEIAAELQAAEPERRVEFCIQENLIVSGSQRLLRIALANLLENAWKFTSKKPVTKIEFGCVEQDHEKCYFVRDNGSGFNMEYVDKIFRPFERLHRDKEFPGTGIGLTIVHRIIQRHGGRIWADSREGQGSTFYFSL